MTRSKVWHKHDEPFNFIKKDQVNVESIAEYLLSKDEDDYFNEKLNHEHHKHGKMLTIQHHPRNWYYGAGFIPMPLCKDDHLWDLTKPIVDKLEKDVDGQSAQIFYLVLPPHSNIYIHIDMGQYYSVVRRHQIPITTNPQCETWVNGETHVFNPGEIWEINNIKPHAVDNNGETSRINLVVDIMPNWAIKEREREA